MSELHVDDIIAPTPKNGDEDSIYNGNGQYKIIPPGGKKAIGYTRATTMAKTIEDMTLVHNSNMRKVCHGLARAPDLQDLAMTMDHYEDRRVYPSQIIEPALTIAGANQAANKGTALHAFTEARDKGESGPEPARHRLKLDAYNTMLEEAGIHFDRSHIEQGLVIDDFKLAGTADRPYTYLDRTVAIRFPYSDQPYILEAGKPFVSDLKSGKNMQFGRLGMCCQMAIYANHQATYNPYTHERGPRLDVDREVAMILHMDQSADDEPIVALYWIDIAVGYEILMASIEVRRLRNLADKAMVSHVPTAKPVLTVVKEETPTLGPEVAEALTQAESTVDELEDAVGKLAKAGLVERMTDVDWVKERMQQLDGKKEPVNHLLSIWPATVPKPFPKEPSEAEIDDFDKALAAVESKFRIPITRARPSGERALVDVPKDKRRATSKVQPPSNNATKKARNTNE